METGTVNFSKEGGVARITISNESRRNAISLRMWEKLRDALADANDDRNIQVVMLRGAGDKAFSAGADISEFQLVRSTPEQIATYEGVCMQVQRALECLGKPAIAAIGGICYGGGLNLAMACDVRLAADTAAFCVPAAKLGIGYSLDEVLVLGTKIGRSAVADLLLSGLPLPAHEALLAGIVQRVWPASSFWERADAYIAAIAGNAPLSMAAIKRSIATLRPTVSDSERAEIARLVAACDASADFREGQEAFREKRRPRFTGR